MPLRESHALPPTLKPSIRGVEYAPLEYLLQKYAKDKQKLKFLKKYEQYFKAITMETSYNQSLKNVTSENSDYLRKHRLWFPYLRLEALDLPSFEDLEDLVADPEVDAGKTDADDGKEDLQKKSSDDAITNVTTTTKEKLKELAESLETNFFNYLHIPYMFGEDAIPPLINHVSNSIGSDIYTLGGLTLMTQEEQNDLIMYITNDGLIPMENVQVNMNYNFPIPLNKEILKSPFMKPNPNLFVYSSTARTWNKAESLSNEHKTPSQKKKEKYSNVDESEMNVGHDVIDDWPPALLAAHSCVISKRHIFYYGGFQIRTKITRHDTSTTIDKEIEMSNEAWVLDVKTLKFKHVALDIHPTLTTRFPNSIPRYGHICMGVPLEETNASNATNVSSKETTRSSVAGNDASDQYPHPALVYIMGGYKQSFNKKDFIPLNDIWKIELFVNYKNKNSNYIVFNDSSLAYPIGEFDLDQRNYDDFPSSKHSVTSDNNNSSDDELEGANQVSGTGKSRRSSSGQSQGKSPKHLHAHSHSHHPSTSSSDHEGLFSGIIRNDVIEWPDTRGFFAGALFDNDKLYSKQAELQSEKNKENSSNNNHQVPMAYPMPKKAAAGGSEFMVEMRNNSRAPSTLGNSVTDATGETKFSSPPPNRSYSPASPGGGETNRMPQQRKRVLSSTSNTPVNSQEQMKSYSSAQSTRSPSSNGNEHYSSIAINKTLIIHGGSTVQYRVVNNSRLGKQQKFSKKKILNDLWFFNLWDEKWKRISTYANSNAEGSEVQNTFMMQEAAVRRCGHTALKLDERYLALIGGALEIDMKNESYFNDYKKDSSSDPKTNVDKSNSSSGASSDHHHHHHHHHPSFSDSDHSSEDLQEYALREGFRTSRGASPIAQQSHDESDSPTNVYRDANELQQENGYHRLLILDTATHYWRTAKYFHNFNARSSNYTDAQKKMTESFSPQAQMKIFDSLRRAFFSNICGTAVTFDARIFIIGGESKPHLPEEITHIKKSSLADEDTKILLGAMCVFEIPLGN